MKCNNKKYNKDEEKKLKVMLQELAFLIEKTDREILFCMCLPSYTVYPASKASKSIFPQTMHLVLYID